MDTKLKNYFEKGARDFDAIYAGKRNRLSAFLDRLLRWDMMARFEETMKECGDIAGLEVLDVGCGSGRYTVELAKRGANVTGIDCAPRMLQIAREMALEKGVPASCRFIEGDFLSVEFGKSFSITVAIGFFDYTADPLPYLLKMGGITDGKLIAAFPRFWTWRAPLRKMRLMFKGCPVYFYTKKRLVGLLEKSGWHLTRMKKIGKLHFVVAQRKK